jgi:MFS family permease
VSAVGSFLRQLVPQLSRAVWALEAGGLANSLGNGIVLPFTIIYLHNVRGFGLGTAGLVVAVLGAVGLATGPLSGRLVDRVGARLTLMCALALSAIGYGCFPLVREPWQAFVLAAVVGAGNGGFAPSHSTLLAALTSREQRNAAYALQRVTDNLGFGLGGLVGGLIATTSVPSSFTLLFLLDAGTFVAFIVLLAFVRGPHAAAAPPLAGSYGQVVRDRPFVALLAVIAIFVACAYAQLTALLPPFAKDDAGVSEAGIGLIFFVNTLVVVLVQMPVARILEGRRRMRALGLAGVIFALTWLGVLATGEWFNGVAAVAALCACVAVFALGECLHGAVQNPLIADLSPPHLLGRYMALRSLAWQLGFMAGPAAGGFALAVSPESLWVIAGVACLGAAALAVSLEQRLPGEALVTPGRPKQPRLAARLSG